MLDFGIGWDVARAARACGKLVLFMAALVASGIATAGTISSTLVEFTGTDASVTVTLDDMTDPGNIVITLDVNVDPNTGDLRGFFLDISDDLLLSGLSITGSEVTQTQFSANSVINLGGGNNLNGGGSPCPCDIGVEIGLSGIGGGDDFQTTTFTLSHTSESLDLSMFLGENVGARLTSVGLPGGSRGGSSKLGGMVPVPEPSTAVMLSTGLVGFAMAQRKRSTLDPR